MRRGAHQIQALSTCLMTLQGALRICPVSKVRCRGLWRVQSLTSKDLGSCGGVLSLCQGKGLRCSSSLATSTCDCGGKSTGHGVGVPALQTNAEAKRKA